MPGQKRKGYGSYSSAKKRKYEKISAARSGDLTAGMPNNQAPGAEYKFLDTSVTTDVVDTATITLLNGMARGDTASTREGRKLKIKSCYIRSLITQHNSQNDDDIVRTMIVYDKQSNGAAPAITDILTASTVEAFNNLDNRERFVVLMDKVSRLASQGSTVDCMSFFKKYIPLNLDTVYNSNNNGDVTDIASGALYLVQLGTEPTDTEDPANSTNVRIRFVDY